MGFVDLSGTANGTTAVSGALVSVGLLRLINRNPEPLENDVPINTNVAFDLTYLGAASSPYLLRAYVNGSLAYDQASGFLPGWDGSGSGIVPIGIGADTIRATINPIQDFSSSEAIEVCVEASLDSDPTATLTECYTFTIEDLTPPYVESVTAIDLDQIEVVFSEGVNDTAADLANYTLARMLDPEHLLCVADATPENVARVSGNTVVITTDVELSPGRFYELTVSGVEDENENPVTPETVQFVAFEPAQPEGRDFDIWGWIPETNRREDDDGTKDLRRWICVVQEHFSLILTMVDRWSSILDVDIAPEAFVDAMLADLGNPFVSFVLSEVDKRRLARVLVAIYKQKGLASGIKNVARFFLGIEIEITPFQPIGLELGISELGLNWVLGSGSQRDLYTFNVEAPIILTEEDERRLLEIINYMKPAHTHLGELVQPETSEVFDHWELGISELGVTTLLH